MSLPRYVRTTKKNVIRGLRLGVKEILVTWLLKMKPLGCPETSVTN